MPPAGTCGGIWIINRERQAFGALWNMAPVKFWGQVVACTTKTIKYLVNAQGRTGLNIFTGQRKVTGLGAGSQGETGTEAEECTSQHRVSPLKVEVGFNGLFTGESVFIRVGFAVLVYLLLQATHIGNKVSARLVGAQAHTGRIEAAEVELVGKMIAGLVLDR